MSDHIKLAKSGDKAAFVALMEENKLSLYRAARALLHNDDDAADAMQDTVLSAWQSISLLKNDEYFKTWLTRILINKCYAIIKKSKREMPVEFIPEETRTVNLDNTIDIRNALNSLPQTDKLILTLFYLTISKAKTLPKF